jgi:hypothetical protein
MCNPVTVEFAEPVREQLPAWLERLRVEVSPRDALPLVGKGVEIQRFLCRTPSAAAEVHVVRARGPWPRERFFAHVCIRLRRFPWRLRSDLRLVRKIVALLRGRGGTVLKNDKA